MKRSMVQNWKKAKKEAFSHQKRAAFFWDSHKTNNDEKTFLNNQLVSLEDILGRQNEYNDTQAELALIRMRLVMDSIDLFGKSHPDLLVDYIKTANKAEGYHRWLGSHILENASTELHILRDSKPLQKWIAMSDKARVREA